MFNGEIVKRHRTKHRVITIRKGAKGAKGTKLE